jgi:class 3 adenylate cyclase
MTIRCLAAILAADVVGYSRLVSADEADALSRDFAAKLLSLAQGIRRP